MYKKMTDRPQVSIATSFQYDIPIDEQIGLVAEAGFSHISLGVRPEHSGYLDRNRRAQLKSQLRAHSLKVDTIHARRLDDLDAISQASASANAATDLDAKCVVVHAGPFSCKDEGLEQHIRDLIATCGALAQVSRQNGVIFALENVMPGPATDLVRRALRELDPHIFGLCYDSAHDQIGGPRPFDLITEYHDRIFAVHLSDRIKPLIDHVIPGEGFIDWSVMCATLHGTGYNNPVLMEVMMTHSKFKNVKNFLKKAYEAGVSTWEEITKNRSIEQSAPANVAPPHR